MKRLMILYAIFIIVVQIVPSICYGEVVADSSGTTSVLLYYNAEATIVHDKTRRCVVESSLLPMTVLVQYRDGKFGYKVYPGILLQRNDGSYYNLYRKDYISHNIHIQTIRGHRLLHSGLFGAYKDYLRIILQRVRYGIISDIVDNKGHQFSIQYIPISLTDDSIIFNKRTKHSIMLEEFGEEDDADSSIFYSNQMIELQANDKRQRRLILHQSKRIASITDECKTKKTDCRPYEKYIVDNPDTHLPGTRRYTYSIIANLRPHAGDAMGRWSLAYAYSGSFIEVDMHYRFHPRFPEADMSTIRFAPLPESEIESKDNRRESIELSPDRRCRYRFDDQVIECDGHALDLTHLMLSKRIFDDPNGRYRSSFGSLFGVKWLTSHAPNVPATAFDDHQFVFFGSAHDMSQCADDVAGANSPK